MQIAAKVALSLQSKKMNTKRSKKDVGSIIGTNVPSPPTPASASPYYMACYAYTYAYALETRHNHPI